MFEKLLFKDNGLGLHDCGVGQAVTLVRLGTLDKVITTFEVAKSTLFS